MPYYFLSSVLVRPTQAARLFLLRFLRTCHRLLLVQAAEGPSYPTRLESSTPASLLVEQQQLQTKLFYTVSICHRLKCSTNTTFFGSRHFVSDLDMEELVLQSCNDYFLLHVTSDL